MQIFNDFFLRKGGCIFSCISTYIVYTIKKLTFILFSYCNVTPFLCPLYRYLYDLAKREIRDFNFASSIRSDYNNRYPLS
jgi:hypothetical protein